MTNGLGVYQAINAVQADLAKEGISKSRDNKQQGYKFRGIDDIYNTIAELLAKHKLVITPKVVSREQVERMSSNDKALFYTTVLVEYTFASAVDGSTQLAAAYGEAMDSGDKSTNKAMSAAYKYLCLQTFCIPTEGDNDADATTHTVKPTAQSAYGTATAMKKKWAEIAAKFNQADTDQQLDALAKEHGADLANFKMIDGQLYDSLIELGVQRRKAIAEADAHTAAYGQGFTSHHEAAYEKVS